MSKRITEEDRFALADQRNLVSTRKGRREVSYPVVGVRGEGARFTDADGREYLDLCMGFGVNLLGHAAQPLRAALDTFSASEWLIGPQSASAGDVARGIASLTGVDRVAFTSSGTEAVMGAVRAARAKTGRDLIAVFAGSYHGTSDSVLVAPRAGGEAGETTPLGRGTPASMVRDVIALPYDESALGVLESYGERLAAVLVEPVQSRRPGYQPVELLHRLRALTSAHGAALIFDEIITGFRCHPRGAAGYFGVRPDMVTYGKVIGGGMPIGVIGGDAEFIAPIDGGRWRPGDTGFPQRPSMVFAGTFSKHPLAMAVAQQMVSHLKRVSPQLQETLTRHTGELAQQINTHAAANGYPLSVEYFSSLFRIVIDGSPLSEDMFFLGLLNRGIYVWEGRTCFLSPAHTETDRAQITAAVAEAAADVAAQGLWDTTPPAPTTTHHTPQPTPTLAPAPAPADAPPLPPVTEGQAPLTDGQKLLWMASELGGDLATSYQMSDMVRIEAALDPDRLRHAIDHVTRRHEALRTGFDQDGTTQNCTPHPVPRLTVSTLSDAAPGDIDALLHRFAQRRIDMSSPSLFAFHLIQTNEASYVQITAPHAVIDAWSFEVLWAELSACYTGKPTHALPQPASFLDYARWKRDNEDTHYEKNNTHWRPQLETAWASTPLIENPGPWTPTTRLDTLPTESLTNLRHLARTSGSTMHTAALTTLAATTALLTGTRQALMIAHQTGQPRHTNKPLVGFCVDILPVIINLPDHHTLTDITKTTQTHILDNSTTTSGLYRTLQQQRYRRLPTTTIGFNYEQPTPPTLFGAPWTTVTTPRHSMPWPAILTMEEHNDQLELLSEISEASALNAELRNLARQFEDILKAPATPLGELRQP